ncbi:Predicted thiol-disulfide oxidoreductase YuxK, DCC family [Halobacillus karajensis]|uniref:Thiol-disulfide oxidoreductase DCC n=1 Tax=Halobacillus karajensis TaxID=195088 RepID=A0A024P6Q4_9BACI|nr:thiol-disulfide oxidoreductase DCC family protein [Halobacillus karajensis]CDQ18203.1 hypothetical protein BN982_00457 [Halobacillus karajensis]CDQ24555.1 hypothetical protein BN983_02843 [Halobacillus karajensis]CDQ29198.1 hypothetical protein BN981_03565 [Halobacillus karajensis]SEH57294.1 Predicted thiol-disulfide oxidoreductase YuxK, DCC family [Halobacillus karajensis]
MERIILFDGECNFCNRSVQFIIKRDRNGTFKFASQQGKIGKSLRDYHQIPADTDSMILIEDDAYYLKSTAALKISKHLRGIWKLSYGLIGIPKPIRDRVYNFIAKNRLKWFGKNDHCQLPSPEIRNRFL